jgi:hypothetical protein
MKNYLLAAFLLISIASCKPSVTPTQINNEISAINDSLKTLGSQWGEAFGKSYMSQDYSALKPLREHISSYIGLKIDELSNMKDAGGSEELKKTELDFLEYEKDMVEKGFLPFEKFSANTTPADVITASDQLMKYSNGEAPLVEKLKTVQQAYAEKNNITLSE